MDKLFIYIGITLGSLIGAYLPVVLLNSDTLGSVSLLSGIIGCFIGLWAGYNAMQKFGR